MMRRGIKRVLRSLGFEVYRAQAPTRRVADDPGIIEPLSPVWPLPLHRDAPDDEEIRRLFRQFDFWHYAYAFENGTEISIPEHSRRALQRFSHFMPFVLESQADGLNGKRVLDIGCNSGFWSFQFALLGSEVIGIDARPELVQQANLIKSITGIENVDFRVLDFWDLSPENLGGTFDVVLNLGVLYHLAKPVEALELTRSLAKKTIVLDTALFSSELPLLRMMWEEPFDKRNAASSGVVAWPSKSALELLFRHAGFSDWFEVPVRSRDLPEDYLTKQRATWIIEV
jgi:SAM-dependent methyltransferase